MRTYILKDERLISVSVLSADLSCIRDVCRQIKNSNAEWIHFDVMDGVFVNNITFGCDILKAVKKNSDLVIDTHLMIVNPIKYVESFAMSGSDYITFHYEATDDPMTVIGRIHQCGKKAGISIRPDTPISKVESLLGLVDVLLIMTVEPGFGGQGFIYKTLEKVVQAKKVIRNYGYGTLIEVDGGINQETSKLVIEAGADILVSGSYLFKLKDMSQGVKILKG